MEGHALRELVGDCSTPLELAAVQRALLELAVAAWAPHDASGSVSPYDPMGAYHTTCNGGRRIVFYILLSLDRSRKRHNWDCKTDTDNTLCHDIFRENLLSNQCTTIAASRWCAFFSARILMCKSCVYTRTFIFFSYKFFITKLFFFKCRSLFIKQTSPHHRCRVRLLDLMYTRTGF